MGMFCFQCQETVGNKGCTAIGVCGKDSLVSNLQDLLIYLLKGISHWSVRLRSLGQADEEISHFIASSLFLTLTNVDFDSDRMIERIKEALDHRSRVREHFLKVYREKNGVEFPGPIHHSAIWTGNSEAEFLEKSEKVGILADENPLIRSLRWTIIYGLKGVGAYADHAAIIGYEDSDLYNFMQDALVATTDDNLTVDQLISWVIKTGEYAVKAMDLLYRANTQTFGHQEITEVSTGTIPGPGILVSGHDFLDLKELLQQTQGKGINIYTHGEMLPANAYPELKKFEHLKGNYGTSWWAQNKEFAEFGGAILMTTNCLTKPMDTYKDRIFTTGLVGWPGVQHIDDRKLGRQKNFTPLIQKALQLGSLQNKPGKIITIGFSYNTFEKY